MPGTLTTYKVFIASAGGLDEFREAFRDIVSRYNTSEAHHRGYMFMPIGWEETITGHGRPQAMINKDLRQCDFALFMFRNRWGTPPDEKGPHTSGTAEEWEIANELQKKTLNARHSRVLLPKPRLQQPRRNGPAQAG